MKFNESMLNVVLKDSVSYILMKLLNENIDFLKMNP